MDDARWGRWLADWQWTLACMERKGAATQPLAIAPPVPADRLRRLAATADLIIPDDFAAVVTGYAGRVALRWHLHLVAIADRRARRPFSIGPYMQPMMEDWPGFRLRPNEDQRPPPAPFGDIFAGWAAALWDVEQLAELKELYADWVRDVVTDRTDPEAAIWRDKTPFMAVQNGDYIAFDNRAQEGRHPVVYFSHDEDEQHGRRLGLDFTDFITRWSRLGCPGPEGWQMQPFYDAQADLLDDTGEAAARWRRWLDTDR